MSEVLKCKFCDWTCKKGWTNKKGLFTSGYSLLQKHVEFQHQKEFMEIQSKLEEYITWDEFYNPR